MSNPQSSALETAANALTAMQGKLLTDVHAANTHSSRLAMEHVLTIHSAMQILDIAEPVLDEAIAEGNIAEIARCKQVLFETLRRLLDPPKNPENASGSQE